ncbi:MAG: hypothetical protein ACI3Y5_03275 [Prevotella sp.]
MAKHKNDDMERDIDQYTEIWQTQDGITTIVNACGYGVWDLHPVEGGFMLELDRHVGDDDISLFCSQLPLPSDYYGEGRHGTVVMLRLELPAEQDE